MVGGEAGAAAQREPEPHAERGRAAPAVPPVCTSAFGTAPSPALPTAPRGPAGPIPLPAAAGAVHRELQAAG